MTEEWRVCPSWPEYEVSDLGRVRRIVKRIANCGLRKPYLSTTGYWFLVMRDASGHKLAVGVHRLVAEAFIGPPPTPDHHIAHADGTRTNNTPGNIRWATRSENERDKVLHGRSNRGSRMGRSILKEADVLEIQQLFKAGKRNTEIGALYGVSHGTISSIRTGKSWTWLTLKQPGFVLQAVTTEKEAA